jgi:hypothetical protein
MLIQMRKAHLDFDRVKRMQLGKLATHIESDQPQIAAQFVDHLGGIIAKERLPALSLPGKVTREVYVLRRPDGEITHLTSGRSRNRRRQVRPIRGQGRIEVPFS